jgi:integrase
LIAAQGSRYAPLFALLVNSGLRRGEALALHWSDIDFDAKLLRVRGTLARVDGELVVTETKTAKSRRVVPLSPTAENSRPLDPQIGQIRLSGREPLLAGVRG